MLWQTGRRGRSSGVRREVESRRGWSWAETFLSEKCVILPIEVVGTQMR
jgi:hypothetical protein